MQHLSLHHLPHLNRRKHTKLSTTSLQIFSLFPEPKRRKSEQIVTVGCRHLPNLNSSSSKRYFSLSRGDWDAVLGPVGKGIPKARPRPASSFKPVTDYVPGFLTAPKAPPTAIGPRRNRSEMEPDEQMRFNTIIQDLSTMFEVTDPNIPKFPLEGGVKRATKTRPMLPTPGKGSLNTSPVSPVNAWSDVSSDVDAQFDKLKEEIASFPTDADILAWMQRRVFLPLPGTGKTSQEPPSFPPTYPLVLAYLIALFRERFSNPELSLAIFAHARSHSVQSYLIGCSTGVYNEMLKTRWECFRDLAGVEEGVKEMLHHGVGWDSTTTTMISAIVEEILRGILSGEEGRQIAEIQYGTDVNRRLANLEKEVEQYVEQAEKKHRMAMHRQAEERRVRRDYRVLEGISL